MIDLGLDHYTNACDDACENVADLIASGASIREIREAAAQLVQAADDLRRYEQS